MEYLPPQVNNFEVPKWTPLKVCFRKTKVLKEKNPGKVGPCPREDCEEDVLEMFFENDT